MLHIKTFLSPIKLIEIIYYFDRNNTGNVVSDERHLSREEINYTASRGTMTSVSADSGIAVPRAKLKRFY